MAFARKSLVYGLNPWEIELSKKKQISTYLITILLKYPINRAKTLGKMFNPVISYLSIT